MAKACSTPGGVLGGCTNGKLSYLHHVPVLNAWRRLGGLHKSHSTHTRSAYAVLNAWRRLGGLHVAPISRADSDSFCAQRLAAS